MKTIPHEVLSQVAELMPNLSHQAILLLAVTDDPAAPYEDGPERPIFGVLHWVYRTAVGNLSNDIDDGLNFNPTSDTLLGLFWWGESPQGHMFWHDLNEKIHKIEGTLI